MSAFIKQSKRRLLKGYNEEEEQAAQRHFILPVHLDLTALACMVGNLQLALRHPANTGPSSEVARRIIEEITQRIKAEGFPVHAEIMRLGGDPVYDEPVGDRAPLHQVEQKGSG
jgi:hypothetical protein